MHVLNPSRTDEVAGAPSPVVSGRPVVVLAPDRGDDLEVRVSAPVTGANLPVVVFSHGFGWSADGYAPLADFWAGHGFVVIQPTHLDSRMLALPADDPRTPDIWRERARDLTRVLDHLEPIVAAGPDLAGRVNLQRVAVAGHSWGAQTAGMLLGARVLDPDGQPGENLRAPRVTAGLLLSATGTGGADLTPFAAEHFAFMNPSFDAMTTPTLVVAGSRDQSPLSTRGPDWFTDAHRLSPGSTTLLTLVGGEHSLGGVPGYSVTETSDENPDRVAIVQRLTWAYLSRALGSEDRWAAANASLDAGAARVEDR